MNHREKIHICHFTSVHNPDDIRIFKKECVSLAKGGFRVTLVAPGLNSKNVKGVQIIGIGNRPESRLKRMFFFSKKVADKARRIEADIYHFHDPELLPFAWSFIRDGKKVIYDAHEDVSKQILGKYWIHPYLRFPVARIYQIIEDLITSRLSAVVSATPIINERFSSVNRNAININNFPFLSEFENTNSKNNRSNQVCYVGGITEIRGAREMILAMEKVSDGQLILAGSFSPSNLKDELEKLPGWKNVIYVGQADRIEVANILSKCKAGLVVMHPLPNHIDAQPNKMFEYMSASLPVIASNFRLWKDVIEGNNCGICVNPLNPDEIAIAIQKIFTQNELVKIYGEKGREAVMQKYNWITEEEKLIEFYDSIVLN